VKEPIGEGEILDLEALLSSSCRRRIIKVLSNNESTNIMQLILKVNSTYNQVNSSLQVLQKEGIIFDEHIGRMRIIRLNKENKRTEILLQALKVLDSASDLSRYDRNQPLSPEKRIETIT